MSDAANVGNFENISDKDKISIILEEYRTLRAELSQKIGIQSQIYAAASAAFVAIVGFSLTNNSLIIFITMTIILLILLIFGQVLLENDINAMADRLRDIETDVNRRARDSLLQWESIGTLKKFYSKGYVYRIRWLLSKTFSLFLELAGGRTKK